MVVFCNLPPGLPAKGMENSRGQRFASQINMVGVESSILGQQNEHLNRLDSFEGWLAI